MTMDIQIEDSPREPGDRQPQAAQNTDGVLHLSLKNQFNIDTPTKEEDAMLREIWEYGKGISRGSEINDIIWEIMHLNSTLGAPRLGESRLARLHRYTKLRRIERQTQDELKQLGIEGRTS